MFTYACTTNLSPACVLGTEVPKHEATACQEFLKLRIWLLAVDKLLSESSTEIMKLGLLGDKNKVPYEKLQKARQPSDIFHVLEEKLGTKAAEQRFIYALKKLGNRRYGFACIEEYRQIVGKHPPPRFETRNEPAHFGLCQCLVGICVKAKEEVSKALFLYCGPLLNINPENFNSLAHMFTIMYQDKKITPDDQEKLAIVLTILEANECIKCIQRYRSKYTFPEIEIKPKEVERVQCKHIFDSVCSNVNT